MGNVSRQFTCSPSLPAAPFRNYFDGVLALSFPRACPFELAACFDCYPFFVVLFPCFRGSVPFGSLQFPDLLRRHRGGLRLPTKKKTKIKISQTIIIHQCRRRLPLWPRAPENRTSSRGTRIAAEGCTALCTCLMYLPSASWVKRGCSVTLRRRGLRSSFLLEEKSS